LVPLKSTPGSTVCAGLRGTSGTACAIDGLRRRDVLLHEHGRHGERIADVVEAEARIIRREFVVGVVVDAEQILDGVAVLDAIEASHRDTAGSGLAGSILKTSYLIQALERRLFLLGTGGACARRA
jgi:hypothetical protein